MNPLRPSNPTVFRAACARLRHTPEFQTVVEYMQQRANVHRDQLVATKIPDEVPRLQGRVHELAELLQEINKTED